jgi:4,5-DOPA dioxygenase extradiol
MDRKDFINSLGLLSLTGLTMKLNSLNDIIKGGENTQTMPLLFVGHGSPMNAIEDNRFSKEMKEIGTTLSKPKAILMVSAHWETKGTYVTAQDLPPTIHDFGGFPKELFDTQYPAPGSKWLDEETKNAVKTTSIGFNNDWGFDHGCWSVTKNMFPNADVPIIQLSLDYTKDAQYHYDLAKQLTALRKKGVLVIGSGNMVHNFGYVQIKGGDFNAPFGHDWALEANEKFKKYISSDDHAPLINYKNQGKAINLSVPTPEHYLPLLYTLALKEKNETVSFFNDVALAGSFSMTSVLIK